MRRIVGILFAIALLLGAGTAVANSGWVQNQSTHSTNPTGSAISDDPVAAPTEIAGGPLSQTLAEHVLEIPELAAIGPPTSTDFSEGGVEAAILTYEAPDGALVDVVSQQLPEPLTVDSVGPPEITQMKEGPNGEDIIIRETSTEVQVIGVSEDGWMVNIIVNRTSSDNPSERSRHTDWGADTVRTWVVELLGVTDGS